MSKEEVQAEIAKIKAEQVFTGHYAGIAHPGLGGIVPVFKVKRTPETERMLSGHLGLEGERDCGYQFGAIKSDDEMYLVLIVDFPDLGGIEVKLLFDARKESDLAAIVLLDRARHYTLVLEDEELSIDRMVMGELDENDQLPAAVIMAATRDDPPAA
jgi:hypothetical protein